MEELELEKATAQARASTSLGLGVGAGGLAGQGLEAAAYQLGWLLELGLLAAGVCRGGGDKGCACLALALSFS